MKNDSPLTSNLAWLLTIFHITATSCLLLRKKCKGTTVNGKSKMTCERNVKSVSSIQELNGVTYFLFSRYSTESLMNAGNELPVVEWHFDDRSSKNDLLCQLATHTRTNVYEMNSSFPRHFRQRRSRSWESDGYRDDKVKRKCRNTMSNDITLANSYVFICTMFHRNAYSLNLFYFTLANYLKNCKFY